MPVIKRSVLVYREEGTAENASTVVVALHGYGASSAQLLPLLRSIGKAFHIFAPDAPQPVSPHVYGNDEGQSWFTAENISNPEPSTFGDSLYQVEQFLLDVVESQNRQERSQVYLLGFDQGAVLALSLACVWPELLGGVVAIQGCLPEIPGWTPPDTRMNGLPFLLVHNPADALLCDIMTRTEAELSRRGARVTVRRFAGAKRLHPSIGIPISHWLATGLQ